MSIYNIQSRKPSDSEQKAYAEGMNAARAGKSWKDNPYPTLSLQHIAWSNGHIWASA